MEPGPDFVTGKIQSMQLIDFMTYDVVKFQPKEHLNIILGPNGTGKSTLVSAILIGMGGDFKKIGRATNLKDYIKHGKESASVIITLFTNESRDTVTFQRDIDKKGKSTFFVNERHVEEERYMRLISRFNIQVDNLCQFLPQDRVQDFALMNPHQILLNTQKSVLPTDVCKKFDKLLELERHSKDFTAKSSSLQDKIAAEEEANERLKPMVERLNQRNAIAAKLNVACVKQKYLQKRELQTKIDDIVRDEERAKANIMTKSTTIAPINAAATDLKKKRELDKRKVMEMDQAQDKHKKTLKRFEDMLHAEENKMMDAAHEFQLKEMEFRNRRQEERKLDQEREAVERAIEEMQEEEQRRRSTTDEKEVQSKLQRNRNQKNDLLTVHRGIGSQIDENLKPQVVGLENRLQSLLNVADQRLEVLRKLNSDLYDAVKWVRQNEGMFSGRIYEPMILELNVKKEEYIKYVENTVSVNDLMAFTCERTQDSYVLLTKLTEQGLRANVLHSEAAAKVHYEPNVAIRSVQHLGLHSYLLQWMDAPVPILNYLCKMYNIHNIPIGGQTAHENLARIQADTKFNLMYIEDMRLATIKSAYAEPIKVTSAVRSKNMLRMGVDKAAIEKKQQELTKLQSQLDALRNKRGEIEEQLNSLDERAREWSATLKELNNQQIKIRTKKTQLLMVKDKIKKLKALPNTLDRSEAEYKAALAASGKRLLETHRNQVTKLDQLMTIEHDMRRLKKLQTFRDAKLSELRQDLEEAQASLMEAKRVYELVMGGKAGAQEELHNVSNQMARMTDNVDPTSARYPHRAVFREMPNDLVAIQDRISELSAEIECMEQNDDALFVQYENRQKQILELKESLASAATRESSCTEEMRKLYSAWYPAIVEMIAVVNENFTKFMTSISVVGEIELITNEVNAYSEFGIGIRVKYKDNGPFLILDRYHHSGGERAVAIATYTLALQKISQVPFRCVDEINQGMDPDNERKIFDMLVEEAARPGMAQYFFVSPKFLPNVKTNRFTAFHIVDSGKYLADTDVFNNSSMNGDLSMMDTDNSVM